MSIFTDLITRVRAKIYQNTQQKVTGQAMQDSMVDVIDTLAGTGYVNINELANHPGAYADAATALADVPVALRKKGLKVVYYDDNTQLWIEMLCIDDFGGNDWWTEMENWVVEGPIRTELSEGGTSARQLEIAGEKRANMDDFLNVNVWNATIYPYETKEDARLAVPVRKRKVGLTITYLLNDGWITEQFTAIQNWGTDSVWVDDDNWVAPVSVTQNTITLEEWAANTDYVIGNQRQNNGHYYRCITAHTSGSSFDTTEETNWAEITDFEYVAPYIQSINIGENDSPISLSIIDINYGFAQNIGDIRYNASTHTLQVRKTSSSPVQYNTVPYIMGVIYRCNGDLWVWNGSDLVPVGKSGINSVNDYILSQQLDFVRGIYNSDGTTGTSSIRLRTKTPQKLNGAFSLSDGWQIYEVYYFSSWTDDTHFVLDHYRVVSSQHYEFEIGDYIIGFSLRKSNNSTITVDDFISENVPIENRLQNYEAEIKGIEKTLCLSDVEKNTLIGDIKFKRGSFDNNGKAQSDQYRVRTEPFALNPLPIALKEGWKISEVLYYSSWNSWDDFVLDSKVVVNKGEYVIGKSNCVAVFSIGKTDDTVITVRDFYRENMAIAWALFTPKIANSPLFEDITPWEPDTADAGYSNPTTGWGQDTKRADWTAEDKYLYYEFLEHYYDTYLGITDTYKVTKKGLWQDGAHTGHEIFEYTFCPLNYKYTVLLSAGMNANETQGIWGLATFIRALMHEEETNMALMKNNICFKVIPIINASGFDENTLRYNYSNGVNPNYNFNYKDSWALHDVPLAEKGDYPDSNIETVSLKEWINSYSGKACLWIDLHTGRWPNEMPNKTIVDARFAIPSAYFSDFNNIHIPLIKTYYINKGYVESSDDIGKAWNYRNDLSYQKQRYAQEVDQIVSIMPEMHIESTGYGSDGNTNNTVNGIKCYVLQLRQLIMFVVNKYIVDDITTCSLPNIFDYLFRANK